METYSLFFTSEKDEKLQCLLLLPQITVVASFRCTGNKSNFYEVYQKQKNRPKQFKICCRSKGQINPSELQSLQATKPFLKGSKQSFLTSSTTKHLVDKSTEISNRHSFPEPSSQMPTQENQVFCLTWLSFSWVSSFSSVSILSCTCSPSCCSSAFFSSCSRWDFSAQSSSFVLL